MKKTLLFFAYTFCVIVHAMDEDSLLYENIYPNAFLVICDNGDTHAKFPKEQIGKKELIGLLISKYSVREIQAKYPNDPKKDGMERFNSFWKTIYKESE